MARDQARGAPSLVVVGASFTAGVGSGDPDRSWAVALANTLHWNAVVYGVAGAGYVRSGAGRQGPVAAEIGRVRLPSLQPALVIVQAGHDDIGIPVRLETQRVEQAVRLIHAEVPRARIALLTVFPGRSPRSAAYRTDHAIVTAGIAADRGVIVIDPLVSGWKYPRSRDGLHPTAAGSTWLAGKVAGILRAHGIPGPPAKAKAAATQAAATAATADTAAAARAAATPQPRICDYGAGYPTGSRNRISVPPPAALSAWTVPPWLSATWRTMASPRPEPGTPLADGAR